MVQLYVADITELIDPFDNETLLNQLPKERKLRILNMGNLKSRKQSLGAGLLLERVLKKHNLSSADVCINHLGKPEINGLYFNLSHSGNMVVCAVSPMPIGCDIEELKEVPQGVAERFFTVNEKAYVEQNQTFFRVWTWKESYIKMTGEGTRLALDGFETVPGPSIRVIRDGIIQDCTIKEYSIPGYHVSVCAMEPEFQEQLMWEKL